MNNTEQKTIKSLTYHDENGKIIESHKSGEINFVGSGGWYQIIDVGGGMVTIRNRDCKTRFEHAKGFVVVELQKETKLTVDGAGIRYIQFTHSEESNPLPIGEVSELPYPRLTDTKKRPLSSTNGSAAKAMKDGSDDQIEQTQGRKDQLAPLGNEVPDQTKSLKDQLAALGNEVTDQTRSLKDQRAALGNEVTDQTKSLKDQLAALGNEVTGLKDQLAVLVLWNEQLKQTQNLKEQLGQITLAVEKFSETWTKQEKEIKTTVEQSLKDIVLSTQQHIQNNISEVLVPALAKQYQTTIINYIKDHIVTPTLTDAHNESARLHNSLETYRNKVSSNVDHFGQDVQSKVESCSKTVTTAANALDQIIPRIYEHVGCMKAINQMTQSSVPINYPTTSSSSAGTTQMFPPMYQVPQPPSRRG
jgi:hypothetical protein